VVPTRDRSELLEALLDSLGRQALDPSRFEVIVVDDASTDATPAVLERVAESAPYELRVVRGPGIGPAAARNRGWREASSPLIAFTDDDCVVTPAWLGELVEAADGDETIVQGRTDLAPGDAEKVGPFSRVLQITEPGPYFATCNVLYPRALLERLDGFDEEFLTGEDTDLGWRAQETGAGYRFASDALVNHAVVDLGAIGKLRWVFRWSHAMRNLSRHPDLRDSLTWGSSGSGHTRSLPWPCSESCSPGVSGRRSCSPFPTRGRCAPAASSRVTVSATCPTWLSTTSPR